MVEFDSDLHFFLYLYMAGLLVVTWLNIREFKSHPDKAARYAALPIYYKCGCWLVVLPLFSAMIFHGAFGLIALVAYTALECACVNWYSKKGLLT